MKRKIFTCDCPAVVTSQPAGDCLSPCLLKNPYICAECGFSQILALKIKPVIAKKAKENLSTHTADGYQGCQNSDKAPIDTKKEVAKLAGVSHDTIAKVETIEEQATPEIKEALRADCRISLLTPQYMDFCFCVSLTLSRLYTPNSFSSRRKFIRR